MKNFVSEGNIVTTTAPAGGVASGVGVLMGAMFGVALATAPAGDLIALRVSGVVDHAKDGSTFAPGDVVYWDNAARKATSTVGTNKKIGVATLAAATGDATARLRLTPTI